MEKIISTLLFLALSLSIPLCLAQGKLEGKVYSKDNGKPLTGVSLRFKSSGASAVTDARGAFALPRPQGADTLVVRLLGYATRSLAVGAQSNTALEIALETSASALEEVTVSTGYYQIPKERATGSFTQVDNELLNRSVGTNILDRLENVASGVQFDRSTITGENASTGRPQIRVRGLSTIEANAEPLLIVDNFPYDGDIATINPNDVESITVLKDAAAASIWGARAGNGVIVINTKHGAYNQRSKVAFNANVNIMDKPDLFYSPSFLPPSTVMDIQKELFDREAYPEEDNVTVPLYAELLIKQRDGIIGADEFARQEAIMRQSDIRSEALDYLYQPAVNQQYALNVSGGGQAYRYYVSAGHDRNRANVIGNGNSRQNLSFQNTFRVNPRLELSASIWYTGQRAESNGVSFSDVNNINPYGRLADEEGNATALTRNQLRYAYQERAESLGLLDWLYRPLDEQRLADNSHGGNEVRINGGARFNIYKGLDINASYQYTTGNDWSRNLYGEESFYARNLVNRFTQANGSRVIEEGGVLLLGRPVESRGHVGRLQLNLNRAFGSGHEVNALAGSELRQRRSEAFPEQTIYGYDESTGMGQLPYYMDYQTFYQVRPQGFAIVPLTYNGYSLSTDRYLSHFGNASYTYLQRYTLSGSLRWDGSNLLGVKTNQRGTALWSVGGSWEASREGFYPWKEWLSYLRLRATYGSAGNIDKSQSHYPTISLGTDTRTGNTRALLIHPGNPSLKWERVNTVNLALDWAIAGNRVSGSVEWYDKQGNDLLGATVVDPTLGIDGANYKVNYADMQTRGMDLQINSRNLTGRFGWASTLLLQYVNNRITNFYTPEYSTVQSYFTERVPVIGRSLDALYALPWQGLRPDNGQPVIYVDGEPSDDYATYFANLRPEDLLDMGVTVAPYFGSLRNTFGYGKLQLDFVLSFKAGHVFRRGSMMPGLEYVAAGAQYHADYFKRWQQPGDEWFTDVPARTDTYMEQRDWVYRYSEALVEPADAIRLQDVSLSYRLENRHVGRLRVFAYARNLGLVWRANKSGIDPDYPRAMHPAPKSIALGLQAEF